MYVKSAAKWGTVILNWRCLKYLLSGNMYIITVQNGGSTYV